MQMWNWLGANGYPDNSVVIITGDHGESLGEHGRLGHTRSLQNAELQGPLWVHEPPGTLTTRDFVFQANIAPIILDLIELPIPASWEGASLLGKGAREWNPIYLMNGGSQFGPFDTGKAGSRNTSWTPCSVGTTLRPECRPRGNHDLAGTVRQAR